ncbi:hypothetical protein BMF94_2386 [Rhodotorula taiwanensis]|uniref:Transcription initiation factor TFIID subunit 13 n=1 Tax=Rhodotorula taiwanensis TaxID=741276 RepID=A0A2S5BCW8_9BASI|nr:hypothetical protein BMF94_2386 [Rhodotorula taiwanensis]
MSANQAPPKQPTQRKLTKKGLFAKDLAPMMYGFGDETPAPDSIALMEELVIDHITDICVQAHRVSTNRGKIKVDDFRFALRNDPKKLARLDELLFMQEEIARARRGFDNSFNDYANDEDLAAARADVAAGITTLGGPSSAANGPQNGGGSGATGFGKKPTLSANASAAGGLALPGGGSSSKGKGKAAAAASAAP